MSRFSTLILRWTLGGFAFGFLFPLVAWLMAAGTLDAAAIGAAHVAQPVLWIVDLAPFVLAGAGVLVGIQHARVDRSLRATDQQVQDRTVELREANSQLEALMASKDRLVAMVSHEVRTPLTSVMGFAMELRDGLSRFSEDDVTDLARLIADQSMEISNIIEDILVAAASDVGSLTIVSEETDLCEQALMVLAACVCADPVRDSIETTMSPSSAWADPGRVRQIVRNLVTNAVRYGGEEIRVLVGHLDGQTSISVWDSGPGIAMEDRETIFEAYKQSNAAKKVTGSVGLGLHVSRTLARAMGGDLIYRHDGGHSIFELTLPMLAQTLGLEAASEVAVG